MANSDQFLDVSHLHGRRKGIGIVLRLNTNLAEAESPNNDSNGGFYFETTSDCEAEENLAPRQENRANDSLSDMKNKIFSFMATTGSSVAESKFAANHGDADDWAEEITTKTNAQNVTEHGNEVFSTRSTSNNTRESTTLVDRFEEVAYLPRVIAAVTTKPAFLNGRKGVIKTCRRIPISGLLSTYRGNTGEHDFNTGTVDDRCVQHYREMNEDNTTSMTSRVYAENTVFLQVHNDRDVEESTSAYENDGNSNGICTESVSKTNPLHVITLNEQCGENLDVPVIPNSDQEANIASESCTDSEDASLEDGNKEMSIDCRATQELTSLIRRIETRSGVTKWCNAVVKVIYILLFFPRILSLIVYLGYDLKCAINEETTFVNCTQEFLLPNPKKWVFGMKVISTISSAIVLFILWFDRKRFNYSFSRPLQQLKSKASFWFTNGLFVLTFAYYIIRIDGSDLLLSIALLAWWPATLLVVYCLNYLRPVVSPDRNDGKFFRSLFFSMGYWFTILMYCAETFCVLVAVMLAAQMNIIPLVKGSNVDYKLKAFATLVVLVRVAFTSRLFAFFWHKIFHGRKDFF